MTSGFSATPVTFFGLTGVSGIDRAPRQPSSRPSAQGEPRGPRLLSRGIAIHERESNAERQNVADRESNSELDDIDALVKKYRARILRFVTFSTGDPDLAESVTQDCLLKAYNARASFRGDSSVNTFLTSIAINLIRDHQRTEKFKFWKKASATAVDVDDVASYIKAEGSSAEARLIAKQKVAQLATVLETLSPNQRMIFLMKFSEEMDLQDISESLNMPINTVKTHLHRALKSVRSQLGER